MSRTARVNVISRDHPRRVDAGGARKSGTRRVKCGESAPGVSQKAVIRKARVSVIPVPGYVIELAHPIQVIDLALLRSDEYLFVKEYIHARAGSCSPFRLPVC